MKQPFEKNFGIIDQDTFKRLQSIRILIVGLGGLGGHIANNLVRLGVLHLHLVDQDVFDITNLNRQLFSSYETIGHAKTTVVKKALLAINPDAEITTHQVRIQDLDTQWFDRIDLVVDAVDDIATKRDLEQLASQHDIPLLHGAIAGWYGQIGLIMPGSNLLHDLYQDKNQGLEHTLGSPTFTPAVVASLMTSEFVKYMMGLEQALINQIMMIDLLHHDCQILLEHHALKTKRKEKRSW